MCKKIISSILLLILGLLLLVLLGSMIHYVIFYNEWISFMRLSDAIIVIVILSILIVLDILVLIRVLSKNNKQYVFVIKNIRHYLARRTSSEKKVMSFFKDLRYKERHIYV